MKVELFDYTGAGTRDPADYAANVLIFTKSTRLEMSPGLLASISAWPEAKKIEELSYMANTVPSSWEFCSYSFIISGVTRAFTHQLVRTRTASYAQQAMRVLDMSSGPGWEYATGPTIDGQFLGSGKGDVTRQETYNGGMRVIAKVYKDLIESGAAVQDARGILPTNILTNICMKLNMRSFIDLVKKRSSARVQDEYRAVIEAMKAEVYRVHPWISIFMDRTSLTAAAELQDMLVGLDTPHKMQMIKLLDLIKKEL